MLGRVLMWITSSSPYQELGKWPSLTRLPIARSAGRERVTILIEIAPGREMKQTQEDMCTKLVQLQVHLHGWYRRDLMGEKKTRPCSDALLPIPAPLAGSIWRCPRRAKSNGQHE